MSVRARALSRLFAALYDQLAPAYDTISTLAFAGEWSVWGETAARFADRTPIVEIGCGAGHTLAWLGHRGMVAFGIDSARPMLAQARRRAIGRLAQGRAASLPLRSASVGTLLSIFPTSYILEPATWREAERVLVPGGRLIVLTHAWLAPDSPRRAILAGCHRLLYGAASPTPPRLPASALSIQSLIERSPHGYAALHVATKASHGHQT
jgi:ubiquinone/menaquinone biosynthesis C-methylase UbiE